MAIFDTSYRTHFCQYHQASNKQPLFLCGDALGVLQQIPDGTIDVCMTSPPYWGKRQYANGGIGLEKTHQEFVENVAAVCHEVHRILKPTGSFWLNMGDSYVNKRLCGIPWRVTLKLADEQGWILRNNVVWHKVKGGLDNTKDRLRNVHENIFHFVKTNKGYYYDVDAIRTKPRQATIKNGAIVSATGVTGVRYKRKIELSTALDDHERKEAAVSLDNMLEQVAQGKVSDFRMVIRGQQRTTHSDSIRVSGRAKELRDKGFYFLKYHPKGSKPSDVWEIIPEDTQKRELHYAPYPEDLCRLPLIATCPPDGIVLDPFCGTGTTMRVAQMLGHRSVGIDIARTYLEIAETRCGRSNGSNY